MEGQGVRSTPSASTSSLPRSQEIAAAVGLDVRTVDWHLLNGARGSEAVGPQAPTALDNQRRKT
jgi:hypothetical protein